jgi:2-dehydro-3-deoxy-L-rhamnonate dehydrogenase (NAD+)
MDESLSFTHQTAVVTGAGSGIGAATAKILAKRGADVVLADLDLPAAQRIAKMIVESGGKAVATETDISNNDSVQELMTFARSRGSLSVLVNSAGITGPLGRKVGELSIDDFNQTLAVNLLGTINLTLQALPSMVTNGYGRIAHVASIAGKEGNPMMAPYNTAKAGMIGFIKGCAKEYAGQGVTINAIAPAVIRSPMVESEPPSVVDYMISRIPMGRMGEPEEVAETLAFIVSKSCSFTTGFVFDASGGRATY